MRTLALLLIFLVVSATAYYVIRQPDPVPRQVREDRPKVKPFLGSNPPSDLVAPPQIDVASDDEPEDAEETLPTVETDEPEQIITVLPEPQVEEPDPPLVEEETDAEPGEVAGVIFTEIMFHPDHQEGEPENTALEYVELHNPTTEPIQLEGYQITRGVRFVFPEYELAPGAYVVVAADHEAFSNHYSDANSVIGGWEGILSNSGETIQLENTTGQVVESIRYADQGDWAQRQMSQQVQYSNRGRNDPFAVQNTIGNFWEWYSAADGDGSSLERISHRHDGSAGQNWGSSGRGGTPGKVNSVAAEHLPPLITEVKHSPVVPTELDEVTISANIQGDSNLAPTVTLHWRVSEYNEGPFQEKAMELIRSGVYAASVPAHSNKTVIEYYVSAAEEGLELTWPAPTNSGQLTNALYQVDDEAFVTGFSFYRIIMTAKTANEFANIDRQSNAQKNVTIIFDDGKGPVARHLCGIRPRGQGSRHHTPVPLKVNLPNDQPWNDVTSMNLNTRYPWLQFIGMKLFTASGLTAPSMIPVQVRINGENHARGAEYDFGAYVHAQAMSTDFVDQMYPNDSGGHLYSKGRPQNNRNSWVHHRGDPRRYEMDGWDKQTKSSAWDWSDLDHFLKTMNEAPYEPNYIEKVGGVIHIDQWLRAFAVKQLIANGEGSIATGADDDYALYRGADDTRFYLLPHDFDTILGMGDGSRIANPQHTLLDMIEYRDVMRQLVPFFEDEDIRRRYFEQMRDLLQTSFSVKTFNELLDNQLKHWVPKERIENMKTFMALRRQYAERQVQNQIGPAEQLKPPSSPTVIAAGKGALRISEVLASNRTAFPQGDHYPDAIELHNTADTEIALGGMSLSDRADEPRRFVFPEETTIGAGAYLTVFAADDIGEEGIYLGFGLDKEGETLTLYAQADAGEPIDVIDTVTFGHQLDDCSIARVGDEGQVWALAKPTFNGPNEKLPTTTPAVLRLNEWMARPNARFKDDFLELCNPAEEPIALGGLHLTDDLVNYPRRFTIPPLSFVGGRDFIVFTAKGSNTKDTSGLTLPFKLAAQHGWIFFNDSQDRVIDMIHYHSQRADISEGRLPNAGSSYGVLALPTPGGMNLPAEDVASQTRPALADSLRVTELMYHPVNPDTEFIELMNLGSEELDLTGVRFTEGIDFEFPSMTLGSGDRIIVVLDQADFEAEYGSGYPIAGEYGGKLSNGGEWITLSPPEAESAAIQRFKYADDWWPETDGPGKSLIIADPRAPVAAWSDAAQWQPSAELGGSPGR